MNKKCFIPLFQESIKTNEKARVLFRFLKQPEFVRPGSRLLFRQGTTKGMGEVLKVQALDGDFQDIGLMDTGQNDVSGAYVQDTDEKDKPQTRPMEDIGRVDSPHRQIP